MILRIDYSVALEACALCSNGLNHHFSPSKILVSLITQHHSNFFVIPIHYDPLKTKRHGKVIHNIIASGKSEGARKTSSIYLFSCSCKKFPVSFLLCTFSLSASFAMFAVVCCARCVRWCYYLCSSLAWCDVQSLYFGYYSGESTASFNVLLRSLRFHAAFKPTAETKKNTHTHSHKLSTNKNSK